MDRRRKRLDPNSMVRTTVYMPKFLHDRLTKEALKLGVKYGDMVSLVLLHAAEDIHGIVRPWPVRPPLTVEEVMLAYARGERVTGPCGDPLPCGYSEEKADRIGDFLFCGECGVRAA